MNHPITLPSPLGLSPNAPQRPRPTLAWTLALSVLLLWTSAIPWSTAAHADDLTAQPSAAQGDLGDLDPHFELELQEDASVLGRSLSMGGVAATHAALYTWAYFAWYRGRNLSPTLELRDEGFFGIDTYAGGADKLGHMYSNYALTRLTTNLLQYGGWGKTTSTILSAGLTLSFFTAIELKDGYHRNFGFSWGDMAFNGLGIGMAIIMDTFPQVDAIFDFKVEYVPTDLFIDQVVNEGLVDAAEDYSGQTFMLAWHLSSVPQLQDHSSTAWMRYLDAVVGFKSTHYLPKPVEPGAIPRQDLFLGLSLNVQQIIDDTFYRKPAQRQGAGYGALAFTNEIVAIPYTTLPLVNFSRDASELDTAEPIP